MTTPTNAPLLTVTYDADGRPFYTPAAGQVPAVYQPQPVAVPMAAAPVVYQAAPASQLAPAQGYHVTRDPIAARLIAGGIGVGAAGFGLSVFLSALAAATTALGILAGILALVFLLRSTGSGGGRGGAVNVHVSNRMTNRNR
ncbi:hypothetical protein [Streptacidiphilus monticola]|uniref:Uncharacterized protein n=1 Tax=Streptacidiphilus monticola TaxID=2161674 RepID=A0ABW1G5D2_9ACTN